MENVDVNIYILLTIKDIFFLFLTDCLIQINFNDTNNNGSFTVADSNSFFESLRNSSDKLAQEYIHLRIFKRIVLIL